METTHIAMTVVSSTTTDVGVELPVLRLHQEHEALPPLLDDGIVRLDPLAGDGNVLLD